MYNYHYKHIEMPSTDIARKWKWTAGKTTTNRFSFSNKISFTRTNNETPLKSENKAQMRDNNRTTKQNKAKHEKNFFCASSSPYIFGCLCYFYTIVRSLVHSFIRSFIYSSHSFSVCNSIEGEKNISFVIARLSFGISFRPLFM